jgi:hypothetical protein
MSIIAPKTHNKLSIVSPTFLNNEEGEGRGGFTNLIN